MSRCEIDAVKRSPTGHTRNANSADSIRQPKIRQGVVVNAVVELRSAVDVRVSSIT